MSSIRQPSQVELTRLHSIANRLGDEWDRSAHARATQACSIERWLREQSRTRIELRSRQRSAFAYGEPHQA